MAEDDAGDAPPTKEEEATGPVTFSVKVRLETYVKQPEVGEDEDAEAALQAAIADANADWAVRIKLPTMPSFSSGRPSEGNASWEREPEPEEADAAEDGGKEDSTDGEAAGAAAEPRRPTKTFLCSMQTEPVDVNDELLTTLNTRGCALVLLSEFVPPPPPPTNAAADSAKENEDAADGKDTGDEAEEEPPSDIEEFRSSLLLDLCPMLAGDGQTEVSDSFTGAYLGLQRGVKSISVMVTASRPLLNRSDRERLNPLSIKVTTLHDLPVPLDNTQSDGKDVPHLPGLFATCKLFPGWCGRRVYTREAPIPAPTGRAHNVRGPQDPADLTEGHECIAKTTKLAVQATWYFLTGLFSTAQQEEMLLSESIDVEVHDRDLISPSAVSAETSKEWGVALGLREPDSEEDSVTEGGTAENTSDDDAAATGTEDADAKAGEEEDGKAAEVDMEAVMEQIFNEALQLYEHAGDTYPHGTATLRLEGLLDQSTQLIRSFAETHQRTDDLDALVSTSPRIKSRVDVRQAKERKPPKGGVDITELTETELALRLPAPYLECRTSVGLDVVLFRPCKTLDEGDAQWTGPPTLEPRPFTRAVFMFRYSDDRLLEAINSSMQAINSTALPDIQGSLRSYQLSEEDVQRAESGELDIVCGFSVIDDDSRLIVLEGLAGEGRGMSQIQRSLPRRSENRADYVVLLNPDVRWANRLYTSFNVDLKRVRVREPLPVLSERSELYNRALVGEECFEAIHRLMTIRKSNRMKELQAFAVFPLPEMLTQLESKYGEAISLVDMDGRRISEQREKSKAKTIKDLPFDNAIAEIRVQEERAARRKHGDARSGVSDRSNRSKRRSPRGGSQHGGSPDGSPRPGAVSAAAVLEHEGTGGGDDGLPFSSGRVRVRLNTANPEFERSRRERTAPDYLAENRTLTHMALTQAQTRREGREKWEEEERKKGPIFVYATQRLQLVERQKAEMRERLVQDKNASFTYSATYASQGVSLVDPDRIAEEAAAESRARWKTQRGFVYPPPKKPSEYARHPKRPSDQRIDALQEPWVEGELHPKPATRKIELPPGQPDFKTLSKPGSVFGGYALPKFDREYTSANVGSRSRLPRGSMRLDENPEFFQSVHIGGDGLAQEQEAARKREKEEWEGKVVVDHLDFKVDGYNRRSRPLQLDRTNDILHDPPKKRSLQLLRSVKMPSGKIATFEPAPLNGIDEGEHVEGGPNPFTRETRPDEFTARDATGAPRDFQRYINQHDGKPRIQSMVARRKHPPISERAKDGPIWNGTS